MSKAQSMEGQNVMIWIGDKVVALSTNCVINYTTNMVDGSTKDDGDMENQEPGTLGWNVTNDFLLTSDSRTTDLDFDALFDKWKAKEKVKVTIGKPTNYAAGGLNSLSGSNQAWTAGTTGVKTGYAYITSMSETHQKGQRSTGNLQLTGVGDLEKL